MRSFVLCAALALLMIPAVQAGVKPNDSALVKGNTDFAVGLYRKLAADDGNLFFSPYSISTALAMTYGGARGNTAKQMADALKFGLPRNAVHPAFANIEARLAALRKSGKVELSVANSIWPQRDYKFRPAYVSLLKKHYGVSVTPVDYKSAAEQARGKINKWTEDRTSGKIKNLIPKGILNPLTRLVLANAIYFKGKWEHPFDAKQTEPATFHISASKSVEVPFMTQEETFGYYQAQGLQVLRMPYEGGLSMTVLLPKEVGGLLSLEKNLTAQKLAAWRGGIKPKEVRVFLPKFKMTSMFSLGDTLKSMGMRDAFDASRADLSGMDGSRQLYITAVIHKAFVDVNEKGTEAAAATGVVAGFRGMPAPSPVFRADRPFIFMIEENRTGSILFMGRVTDPSGKGE